MTLADVALGVVGLVVVTLVGGGVAGLALGLAGRAIGRSLPDEALQQYQLGAVPRFTGFDEQAYLRWRLAVVRKDAAAARQSQRFLERRLAELEGRSNLRRGKFPSSTRQQHIG